MLSYRALLHKVTRLLTAQPQGVHAACLPMLDLQHSAARADAAWTQDIARAGLCLKAQTGEDIACIFNDWRQDPPSIAALVSVAAQDLALDPESTLLAAVMLAALAADIPYHHPYHDNHHFREVTAMMACYCRRTLNPPGFTSADAPLLSSGDIAKCLLAAVAHDLHHDGGSNGVAGQHRAYRLEDRAIQALRPLMTLAGVSIADQTEVETLIRITDTSAPPGGISPHHILAQLWRHEDVSVPDILLPLAHDRRLQHMAALMSDADLAPSAGLTYSFAMAQTRRLAREAEGFAATDHSLLGFLDHVMKGRFLSPAALALSQPQLDAIGLAAKKHIHCAFE